MIGSGTAEEYRNSAKSPVEIGRELSVDYLLSGEMHWTGDGASRRLVVSPKLLDARTGAVLWQKDATVEEGALPGVSSELAAGVGGALGITPSADEQRLLEAWPTKNEEAYRAGLRGRQVMSVSGTDPATLRAGISELEQAVALDSTYARAWAALAIASANLYLNGNRDPRVAEPERAGHLPLQSKRERGGRQENRCDPDALVTHVPVRGFEEPPADDESKPLAHRPMLMDETSPPPPVIEQREKEIPLIHEQHVGLKTGDGNDPVGVEDRAEDGDEMDGAER